MNRRAFVGSLTGMGAKTVLHGAGQVRAGAASTNITPPLGVSLDGTIMQIGPAVHVHDELHARCLALDDGTTRLAMVVADCTMISQDVFDRAKRLVHEHTGLPMDRMLMSATHTHSAPRVIGIADGELDRQYTEFLVRRIADSARLALNNLAPAKVGWGSGRKPELLFNRRWHMKPGAIPANPFGETAGQVQMNPPRGSTDLVKPAGPTDPEVFVLSIQYADGRPLALLANYGLHYVGGFILGHISADYFGFFARRIRQLLGADGLDPPFLGIMSNGTSGDVSGIDARAQGASAPPYSRMGEVASSVAEEVLQVYRGIDHRGELRLSMREAQLELGVRRPDGKRLAWAQDLWAKAQGKQKLSRPEIYARETILLGRFPAKVAIKLQALRVGDVGIAAIPCEVFAETGLALKAQSRPKPAFTFGLANGYYGYLPTAKQHELGGYETWAARSSFLEVQAEARILDEVMRLLSEV